MRALIFGSAVETPEAARDVDVVYDASESRADAIALAKEWAAARGLGHLPVDAHCCWSDGGALRVPTPCDAPLVIEWLTSGDRRAVPVPCWTVAGALRAYGDDAARAVAVILDPPERAGMELFVDPSAPSVDLIDGGYVTGLTALRSAAAHAAKFGEICDALPHGRIIRALVERDPHPAGVAYVRAKSPGGAPRLYPEKGGLSTHYGGRLDIEDVMALLFEGIVPDRAGT